MSIEKDFYLEQWSGEFGEKYTDRCRVTPTSRADIFKEIISGIFPNHSAIRVLEVGCNRGHNLIALTLASNSMSDDTRIGINPVGIEPQKKLCRWPNIINGNCYNLPWGVPCFDLVFTSGVLIHIPPEKLADALSEMNRVSKKYILMIEQEAESETPKNYRDFEDKAGFWARPYGDIFHSQFPETNLVKYGKVRDIGDDGWGFTDCSYWVFKK